jgi:MFS transporter, CP family, cyanate transporter
VTIEAGTGPGRHPLSVWWFGAVIVLVAANLRPAVVGVGPLLAEIQASERLSGTAAGVLTALPLLCFGLLAPLAPVLARRIGIERALLVALVVLCVGFPVRSSGPIPALYAGTVLLGSTIAIGNVLLPGLIKRDFARHTGIMTGLYTMAISGGGALAAGITVPVASAAGLDWRAALGAWGLFALVALVCWLPQVRRVDLPADSRPVGGLWRDALAWQITAYMGLQSLGFYALSAWLPVVFIDRGYDPAAAGWLLAMASIMGAGGSLTAPVLASTSARHTPADAAGGRRGHHVRRRDWADRGDSGPRRRAAFDDAAWARPGRGDRPRPDADGAAGSRRRARSPAVGHGAERWLRPGRGGAVRRRGTARRHRWLDRTAPAAARAARSAGHSGGPRRA